jgi:hypothetical protein
MEKKNQRMRTVTYHILGSSSACIGSESLIERIEKWRLDRGLKQLRNETCVCCEMPTRQRLPRRAEWLSVMGKKGHTSHMIQVSLFSKQQLAGTSGQIMSLFKTHALEPAHATVPTPLVVEA